MIGMHCLRLVATTAVMGLAMACSNAPSSPSPSARTAESITVTGARSLVEGETVALAVTVRWSTGVTEPITDGVQWASDDPQVAVVDSRGVVTAAGPGDGRIRATFNALTATVTIGVAPALRTISGAVHESAPTEHVAIGAATVSATDARGNTQSTVTDSSGRFSLRLVRGVAQVSVTAAGFEPSTAPVNITEAPLSLALAPVRREIRLSFDYIYPEPKTFIEQRTYRINVHHAGELRAEYTRSYQTASPQAHTCLEVRDAANRTLMQRRGAYDIPASLRMPIAPGVYEVKFSSCTPWGGPPTQTLAAFAGELRHPS
jgi:hypothetical protein